MEVKEIEVEGKSYDVMIVWRGSHYCAYVTLKDKEIKDYMDLGNCTYQNDNVFGVDTAHYYNFEMTAEQKKEDAIEQIKDLIKEYNAYKDRKARSGK